MDTCDVHGKALGDTCPDCGEILDDYEEDENGRLTLLTCTCGFQCVDDPDDRSL